MEKSGIICGCCGNDIGYTPDELTATREEVAKLREMVKLIANGKLTHWTLHETEKVQKEAQALLSGTGADEWVLVRREDLKIILSERRYDYGWQGRLSRGDAINRLKKALERKP